MDIKSLTYEELQNEIMVLDEPKFRAGQIFDWAHNKQVDSIEKMSNLSKAFREKLKENYEFTSLKCARMQESASDGTKKFLFELSDGNYVESVFMKYHHGNSVCISSQVGCRMGCKFCASTLDGLERNLLPGEMLDQIYRIAAITGEKISNIVVMGTGEPLDNYDNLLKFIHLLNDERGMNLSQRNITVSTCGIVPKIKALAEEKLQITLALSLHAPTDEKRKALMPIANSYSLNEVMDACRFYFDKTGRRVSFEYALVSGVNDRDEEVSELTHLLKGMNCHINLIPVNPIKEREFKSTNRLRVLEFQKKLEKNGINVTIRREMGRDIDGACGQLRRRVMQG